MSRTTSGGRRGRLVRLRAHLASLAALAAVAVLALAAWRTPGLEAAMLVLLSFCG